MVRPTKDNPDKRAARRDAKQQRKNQPTDNRKSVRLISNLGKQSK